MGFPLSILPDLPQLMNAVRDYGGVEVLVAAFERAPKNEDGKWFRSISMLQIASVYYFEKSDLLGIRLPFDLSRGTLDQTVLKRWLATDPVNLVDGSEHQDALRALRLMFVE